MTVSPIGLMESHTCCHGGPPPPTTTPLPGMRMWWMVGALSLYPDKVYLFHTHSKLNVCVVCVCHLHLGLTWVLRFKAVQPSCYQKMDDLFRVESGSSFFLSVNICTDYKLQMCLRTTSITKRGKVQNIQSERKSFWAISVSAVFFQTRFGPGSTFWTHRKCLNTLLRFFTAPNFSVSFFTRKNLSCDGWFHSGCSLFLRFSTRQLWEMTNLQSVTWADFGHSTKSTWSLVWTADRTTWISKRWKNDTNIEQLWNICIISPKWRREKYCGW